MFYVSNKLRNKFPILNRNQTPLSFIIRLLIIGLVVFLIKKVYGWNCDENGNLNFESWGYFNPIEFLRQNLIRFTSFILSILGYTVEVRGWVFGIPNGLIKLETPCLGINVCFIFLSLVLAFPSKLKIPIITTYIIIGITLIQILNILRFIGMMFVVKNHYKLPIEHHDIFNFVIYAFVIILFYNYVNFSLNPPKYLASDF